MISLILRYYHTLRYLKPIQLVGWVYFLLPRFIRASKRAPRCFAITVGVPHILKPISTKDYQTFTFLNQTEHLPEKAWDHDSLSKLWRYHLHYFDYLLSSSRDDYATDPQKKITASALIQQWIAENPFGLGTGWEPYPTSLRLVNWIKWMHATAYADPIMLHSVWNQLRYLADRLEYHLRGNHLLANAKALIFAASLFDDPKARRYQSRGLRVFFSQLEEQFLPDGAHVELSPMYHAIAMEDLMDVYGWFGSMLDTPSKAQLKHRILKGLEWLTAFTYDDGTLAYFNDVSEHQSPSIHQLVAYAQHIGLPIPNSTLEKRSAYFSDSGYVCVHSKKLHALLDIGKIGPDWLPGHAHADTLCFELAIQNQRILVNSGTSLYGISEERQRQRSTRAHNTIVIDDENSSQVWASFRVAQRAYPFDVEVNLEEAVKRICASHDGYQRLDQKNIHRRAWEFDEHGLTITDEIMHDYEKAQSRWYFHPDIELHSTTISNNKPGYIISKGSKSLATIWLDQVDQYPEMKVMDTTFHPEFGISIPNKCLVIDWRGGARMKVAMRLQQ